MTIQQALDMADQLKPNMMSTAVKIGFLNEIEGKLQREIIATHEATAEELVPRNYDTGTDPATELLIPAPYDGFYPFYIMMQIDILNQEADKYNNDAALFGQKYQEMNNWWNRTRMPVSRVSELRI